MEYKYSTIKVNTHYCNLKQLLWKNEHGLKNLLFFLFIFLSVNVCASDGSGSHDMDWMIPVLLIAISVFLFVILLCFVIRNRQLERLVRPLSMIPVQMGICDAQGRIFYYQNGRYERTNNSPRSLSDLPVEMQQEFLKVLPKIFQNHETQSVEFDVFKFRHKVDFFYLKDNQWSKEPVTMWMAHDITKLHQVCLEREQVAERFRRTLASIGDAVIVTNFDGEVIMMNSVATQLCNITPQNSEGRKIDECFHLQTIDLRLLVEKVIRKGCEYPLDSTLSRNEGDDIRIEGKISPVKESESLIVGTVLCFRDITERIRLHRQEQKALKLAQIADRTKSDFIAVINHEFRSSLNSILSYCELMRMGAESKDSSGLLKIQNESNKLLENMNNLLDFSQSDIQNMQLIMAPANFKDLIYEIQRIFLKTSDNKKIPLQVHVPAELPLFMSDYKVMRQILIGFLTQTFSIAAEGEIVLSICWEKPCLRLEIEFVAEHDLLPEPEPELPVNRQLLQSLNGIVEFRHSNDREKLCIIFPEMESCGYAEQALGPVSNSIDKPHKDIVMIVDDIPVNLQILSMMLKKFHIDSVSCVSAKEALAELENYTPVAILTDLWMPECNGDEFATILKSSPQTAEIPTVLVTADNQIDHRICDLFCHTIFKPLNPAKLKLIMDDILNMKSNPIWG